MPSAISELRSLTPHRTLPPWEARILAERQANKLLALQGVRDLPVPEQLIELLPRIEVLYRRSKSLSGTCRWTGGRWVIVVNANDTWGRQRFSLAHEFKHVVDAPVHDLLYPETRFASADRQRERAADYFAACLLMPRAWLKRAFYDEGMRDPLALARRFQVSVTAMRWRLEELGLQEPQREVAA